jgi:EAL domain-containing protein (putative c-di-GMP-specific phosphodiesterase class I)
MRYREQKEMKQITELLERLPRNQGFSASSGQIGGAAPSLPAGNEQLLMPQIKEGMRTGEFVFYLQTKYDLNTRKVIGGEALVRWNHGKLGTVSPAVFIPVLESNGYITKLDRYIWEQVFVTIRNWIDNGIHPVPLAINATKTDILAMDIAGFMEEMLKKYRIPPRYLEVEIAENAYLESPQSVLETEEKLRQLGFRVIMDGFNGDYISLSTIDRLTVDVLKLDLRRFDGRQNQGALNAVFEQARKININVAVEGIESMEQLTMLRRCGCSEGQGFYLSRPIPVEEFEKQISGEGKQ